MIAVEEKCFKSVKTDASLYNGRPTDTGTQCHSTEGTFSTPSIPKDKDGVSVENVHKHRKQWFVLRVSYGRIFKVKEIIDARNIECYAPMRYKQITKHGKKYIITEPLIPSFIFVHSSQEEVDAILHDKNKLGDHVIVTEGDYEGIQDREARMAGQLRVIVELFSGCLVATAYIPKEAMKISLLNS